MSRYSALFKNIGLFTVSNIAIKLVTFLLVPLYTYYLSASEFGITDMLNTVISLITPLATASISDSVLRFCVEDGENSAKYISTGFYINLASCVLVALMLPFLDFSFFGGLGDYKIWFLIAFAVMTFQLFFSNIARGLDQVKNMIWASVISSVTNIVLAVAFIAFMRMGVEGFFLSLVIGNLAGCCWYLIFGKYYRYFFSARADARSYGHRMLIYSLPLIPNSLFWWASQSINRFFITGMIGIAASGLFASASKFPAILNIMSNIFQQAWNLSAFQEFKSAGQDVFFSKVFKLYNAGIALCAGFFMCISSWVARFFLQGEFYQAWPLIPLLLLAFYYSTLSAYYGTVYTASMKTRYLFVSTLAGAGICTVTLYFLIRWTGLPGAGIASVLGNGIVWLMRVHNSRSIIRIKVNPLALALGNICLIVSAVVLTFQIPYSSVLSWGCFVALLLIMYWDVRPTVQEVFALLGRRKF
ncbi:lipopolysaccharide biosynthesis protein [Bifidobacterium panos]|uniref:Multidrug transporter n=1 Tax=Bifidobacterium panos TaxID=2675321 RepID=A0ABX1SXA6_9BIFI|nr:oligosaccharide flippase family protein [Bifidobacterium sp. DSM 109963]NMN02476.1 multidrug transporter [Bifidobacterium sp. DSM 109963]